MIFLYELGIRLFVLALRLAAFFNPKAKKWVEGRQDWRERCRVALNQQPTTNNQQPTTNNQQPTTKTLWLHAASLGEFEQGRPIIEAFREQNPHWRVVLTFFSPSGYEIRKNYPHADLVCYLPADTRRNARDFLNLIKPDVAIFVKYDFWANHLFELKKRGVPTLLVSALFREKQPFFHWWGGFWREMLACFTHIFVQNEDSAKLLQSIGFAPPGPPMRGGLTVAGDTRVDRVLKIAEGAKEDEIVAAFCPPQPPQGGEKRLASSPFPLGDGSNALPPWGGLGGALIAGSSWEADEAVFLPVFQKTDFQKHKLIVAPHEPSEANVERLCRQVESAVRYSQMLLRQLADQHDSRCLIIDNIVILNTLYRYGTVAYIGGGFGKGIHNTLEPAAFGLPVIFGPRYEKFEEARQMVARGGAFSVGNSDEFEAVLTKLQDPVFYEKASQAVRGYLEESRGATAAILAYFEEIL